MICDNCRKNVATVYVDKTVNGKVESFSLCSACANKLGIGYGNVNFFNANSLLKDLFSYAENTTIKKNVSICPICKTSKTDIENGSFLGCSKCYEAFSSQIDNLRLRLFQNTTHKGKVPLGIKKSEDKISMSELEERLKAALNSEDYEKACIYRDEIRARKGGNNG